ncbi:MAG: glycosyltransferase family 4 protein [Ilumatobacteraceae bacterium]
MTSPVAHASVAVNLLWISPGRVGGSEQYLHRQLLGLATVGVRTRVHCTRAFAAAHPELGRHHDLVVAPGGRDVRAGRVLAEHSLLAVRTRRADLVHHGGGTAPLVGRRPIVLTVHDLQYLAFPQYFSAARRSYLAAMMPRSVARASVVTVPSEFVRHTVVDAFDIDPEQVVVVPHGVPETVRPDVDDIAVARRDLGLGDRPYVVYPAITHPHKGHQVLVDMLDHLSGEIDLVLLGGAGAAESAVTAAIAASSHRSVIHRPGRVHDRCLDALLAGADALVFPSEYEGFGAPLVEAMAAGVPVVCSDAAAVTEVVDGAAVVVGARSGEAWADGVREALRRREELVALGAARRAAFTVERSGAALTAAYGAALDRTRS